MGNNFSRFDPRNKTRDWSKERWFVHRVLEQPESTSDCAACSVTYALEFLRSKERGTPIEFSAQWFVDHMNANNVQEIVEAANENPICQSVADYPYEFDGQLHEDREPARVDLMGFHYRAYVETVTSLKQIVRMIEKGPVIANDKLNTIGKLNYGWNQRPCLISG
ncbi:hypothetical protein M3Y98_00407000 [Aphelenchoides besseyi]|nr:hypothetical protein M3Y98_00407000 [Aphelenchoides besseyi]